MAGYVQRVVGKRKTWEGDEGPGGEGGSEGGSREM